MKVTGLTVLGATGSVGRSTLGVVAANRSRFRVVALTARRDDEALFELCKEHRPQYAVLMEVEAADRLAGRLAAERLDTEVLRGPDALETVATLPQTDAVMAAIVGAAGLLPTLAAARAGRRVLLANKEAVVMAGRLLMDAVRAGGAELIPIDSEHNAIFQCLPPTGARSGVRRLVLTASGGPFLERSPDELHRVTPEEACAHPNWTMGPKISVDSATMMNKGLEIIEACWLFDMPPERVDVLVHPQSIVHSMVEYTDGSVLAQMGCPDMRTPIAHALGWPDRIDSGAPRLDLAATAPLAFQPADEDRFPCLALARRAAREGGTAPAVLNAANEEAVAAFLEGRLAFTGIAGVVGAVLDAEPVRPVNDVDGLLAADGAARERARAAIAGCGTRA